MYAENVCLKWKLLMYAQNFYKLNLEIAEARSKLLLNNEIADIRST